MLLDHVGIAVEKIEEALDLYRLLGFHIIARGQVETFNVEVCMLDAGGAKLELLAPLGPGAVQSFLEKRGPGLHHVAFNVTDIRAELDRLGIAGMKLVHEAPRLGFGGHQVAFLHPKSTLGALIELVQA